ncbi:MAG: aldehyde dehydrogenase family protein [Akkermansiaceae bacterium]|nr:aldehyde dehydrogenase family protein [Akkermansiaceae bacterium]
MLNKTYPAWLAGERHEPNHDIEVLNKYSGETATRVPRCSEEDIEHAIAAADECRQEVADIPPYERRDILNHCVKRFEEREDELANALCVEAGKPISVSRGEVTRLIDTFRYAAEEAVRIGGEVMNMEISERAKGRRGMWKHVPIGPCSFISPFNFPLNLAAHKIAPAIAAGCPFVLKPATATPVGALLIGEVLAETDFPAKGFSILPCSSSDAGALTTDERMKLLSFTGSPDVGWKLKEQAGKKKVVLELGGNAACVIDEDADIEDAIPRVILGTFYQSGQSCIGVQRLMVHKSCYDKFKKRLIEETEKLKMGDPADEETFVGPMIDEDAAKRVESWIEKGIEAGGKLLCGGKRNGVMLEPSLLEDVPPDQDICAQEAFGPVAVLSSFEDYDEVLDQVNDSRYGLQAGVFTRNIEHAMAAWDRLVVGGVIINDVPSWRVDHMPYGGVKDSGIGREGVVFAIEDMSEVRNLVIRTIGSD